jgi:hypothetical protein
MLFALVLALAPHAGAGAAGPESAVDDGLEDFDGVIHGNAFEDFNPLTDIAVVRPTTQSLLTMMSLTVIITISSGVSVDSGLIAVCHCVALLTRLRTKH